MIKMKVGRTIKGEGAHVTVNVWAGTRGDTVGHCGQLIMRPDEARELLNAIGHHASIEYEPGVQEWLPGAGVTS